LKYFQNNVTGSFNLIEAMQQAEIKNLVFSSSATVYGIPENLSIDELAIGHIAALDKLKIDPWLMFHNLGTGNGYSVLEVI
jgi:UDP-glucose 4-epimerase